MANPTISYDDAVMGVNAAQTVQAEREKGCLDPLYYRIGVTTIFKGAQCILSIIAYIIMEVGGGGPSSGTQGWFSFVALGAFFTTGILWLFLLLKVPQRCLQCECVNWPFAMLVYYIVIIVCWVLANIILAASATGHGGAQAACAFGFFAMFVYIADTAMTFRVWWTKRGNPAPSSGQGEMQSPVSDAPKY